MHSDSMKSLETESVGRLLLKYALPAIAGMIVFSIYNVVDSIFIGRWVGEYALAALAVAFPVMNLSTAIGTLIGVGGGALCSIRLGEQKKEEAMRVFGNVFVLAIIVGVIFGVLSAYFLEPVLIAFGASEETLPYAYDFMLILQLSVPITYTFFNFTHMMRASGYPNRALAALTLSVVVNIILAPLFIKVFDWGIVGAAWATVGAQLAGMVYVIIHFLSKNHTIHFRRGIYRLRMKTILPVLSIGMAPSIMNICGCAVAVIINRQLMAHGGDLAIGAYGIFSRVVILAAMVVMGLTQGMQPIVGYNHGAGRYDRVRKAFRLTLVWGTVITTLGFFACEFFPEAIARCFTENEDLIKFTVLGLRVGPAAFAIVGIQIVINNFFQAIGHGKTSAALSTTRQLVFLVPGLLIFPFFWGQVGVWIAFPIADVISVTVTGAYFLYFMHGYKPNENLVMGARGKSA